MHTALLVVITFLVYSCSSVFSKLASQYDFMSVRYIVCLMGVIMIMGLYAVLWQLVLRRMPLNKAFSCKSMTIVFTLLFSYFIFDEVITVYNIIGIMLIVSGLMLLVVKQEVA